MSVSVPKENISIWNIFGRVIACIVLIIFEYQLIMSPITGIIIDSANFIIHETGHVIFSIAGEFMQVLGGSLFQVLVPIIALMYFRHTKQYFASGFSIFWLGDNVIRVSIYMSDARAMVLPLYGVGHDWNWLLSHLNLLEQDHFLGGLVLMLGHIIGIVGILLCLVLTLLAIQNKFVKNVSIGS